MSESAPSPVLPLPSIKSPRPPFTFSSNEPYMPPDPSRFTHFMPSPISSGRSLDLPSPSLLGGIPLASGSASGSGGGGISPGTAYTGYKRSYTKHDTASPEAGGGSSVEDDRNLMVKEEGDELGTSISSSATASDNASGRALKNTKRAAQNRAAQQAFRKRKEERIRELEDKERELQGLKSRSEELRRREQELLEREQLFALRQIKADSSSSSSSSAPGTSKSNGNHPAGNGSYSSHFPYGASYAQQSQHQHNQLPPIQTQQQNDGRLEDAHKMLLAAQADYNELKRQLDESDGLIAALRRSLEDMGAENRALRAAAGLQSPSLAPPTGQTSDTRGTSGD